MTISDEGLKYVTFSEADIIDKDRLERKIEDEATRIYQSDEARYGRTLEQIKEKVRQGKVAELFLIEKCCYEEADIMWHDLKNSEGEYTEVKAYSNIWDHHAPQVAKDLKRYRSISKFKSKWYILFSVDDRNFYKFIAKMKIKE
jgi:hypothetical protein